MSGIYPLDFLKLNETATVTPVGFFSKLFGNTSAGLADPTHTLPLLVEADLVWREGTTLPVPEWNKMSAPAETNDQDAFWSGTARLWLERLREQLGEPYHLMASENFLLLTPHPERPSRVILDYAERSRSRVLRVLDGIARDDGFGHSVILMFASQEAYYEYVSHYYPDGGEYAFSSGMFLDHGYGHFVFCEDEINQIEPIVVHELTHCYVRHLPIPAWLNEGLAVNTETRIVRAPPSVYTVEQMQENQEAFWDAQKIQEFWSGKSWLRPDQGNLLSYDLAQKITALLANDFASFTRFTNAATSADAGAAAAHEHLGFPIEHTIAAVLGEGDWSPRPETWDAGVEHGQF